jgi:hypothetical protein
MIKATKKNIPADCALSYCSVRFYHTLRDLSAGRQNAIYSEHWLTRSFRDRDYDNPQGNQFDLRDVPAAPSRYKPAAKPEFSSKLLLPEDVRKLQHLIDTQKAKEN